MPNLVFPLRTSRYDFVMQALKRGLCNASRFTATGGYRAWSRGPVLAARGHVRCIQTRGNVEPQKRDIRAVYDMDWQPPTTDVEMRTLLHDHLVPSDFVDLSNSRGVAYNPDPFAPAPKETPYLTYGRRHKPGPDNTRIIHYTPFPVNTRGFFYYFQHPRIPEGGSIRFRVMQTNDPKQFSKGQDLLNEFGTPWQIPLLSVATQTRYEIIKDVLEFEGAVSPELFKRCEDLTSTIDHHIIGPMSQVICEIMEPFYLDLSNPDMAVWVAADELLYKMTARKIFKVWQRAPRPRFNYDGGILICSLRVIGPQQDKIGLFCHRIVEPVQVKSGIPRHLVEYTKDPSSGQLLRTHKGMLRKIFVNSDRPDAEAALQTLLHRFRQRYSSVRTPRFVEYTNSPFKARLS
ncbi:hypothetical protein BC628DRAFT_1344605 [Trametes gibbosa]|nr:hypothetical protein BC628DRAFT_1344605 [Trametes gibbosa]